MLLQTRRINPIEAAITGIVPYPLSRSLLSTTEETRLPKWLNEFIIRVTKFKRIQEKRGFLSGAQISNQMIEAGHLLLMRLMPAISETPRIVLDDEGKLRFEWDNGDKYLTIVVHEKGVYEYFAQTQKETEDFTGDPKVLRKLLDEVLA